ncbi:hypothetical protein GH714_011949 [Hevea brasiliensis]|uniref:Reverse transcriptase RNase H-like domain-containing protein n=1 Tax=Hevea brasiliensis TaxID=3981 RepID=A0A6A6N3B9_HEVBR|nr:hypothetical protein GH714_011949 [Hevea brasiliensis]
MPKEQCLGCMGHGEGRPPPRQEGSSMGSMQLGAIDKGKQAEVQVANKGRLFAQLQFGQNVVQALVDTGATDNFLRLEEAQKLGIAFQRQTDWLKAVNSAPTPTHSVANNVAVKIGEWIGSINFSIVAMDDYACVLGMEFMDKVKAIPIPFANSLCIVEHGGASMVPLKRKSGGSSLSALQLAKGVRKNEPTFLVALHAKEEGRHSIAYESRKLNDTERRYTIQEKEMTAVVHCIQTWRHYLLGSKFTVKTDNVATSYFLTQRKLSPKQARWQAFMGEFDFVMEYKPRKANLVADALSRKVELAVVTTQLNPSLLERIVEGLQHDPQAKLLLELIGQGKTRWFWRDDQGLVRTRRGAVFVPRWGCLRKQIISECHDTWWAGHPGAQRTQALVERGYYWPRMVDDIQLFVKTCLIC